METGQLMLYLPAMAHPRKTSSRSAPSGGGGRLRLGPRGRLVLPPALRRALGVQAGEELSASVENGALVLRTPRQDAAEAVAEMQARWAAMRPAGQTELESERLLRERREEAAREEA